MEMRTSVEEIRSHVKELTALNNRFSTLSNQSADKFKKIVLAASVYQNKMEPLNQKMVTLQVLQQNIDTCYDKLSQVQVYRKTARELERTVERGPSTSLQSYLDVMQQLQETFEFFKQHGIDDVDSTRLQALYTLGMNNLTQEFVVTVKETFRSVNVERLFSQAEQWSSNSGSSPNHEAAVDKLVPIEDASVPLMDSLHFLLNWMKTSRNTAIAMCLSDEHGERECMTRYHEYRRQVVRIAVLNLAIFLKEREKQSQQMNTGASAKLVLARAKRPPGFVWDVALRRQVNNAETEDLNSEHLATIIAAFVILMQNERKWLERIRPSVVPNETQKSLDSILKVTANELLTESRSLIVLMQSAEKRAEYHMVLSLLFLLRKLALIGPDLVDVLQGVDHILFGFNSLTHKLLQETASTLKNYVDFLVRLPEFTVVNRLIVPPDGTVHELTTNSFMFLENLVEFADVLSVAFHVDEIGPQGTSNVITFLSKNIQNYSQFEPVVGRFLVKSIEGLIGNLNCKASSYSEEIIKVLFKLNNLQYILTRIHRTDIHRYILSYNPEGIAAIKLLFDDCRVQYTRLASLMLRLHHTSIDGCASGSLRRRASVFGATLVSMLSPSLSHSSMRHVPTAPFSEASRIKSDAMQQSIKLDPKDRTALKGLWQDFNNGFHVFVRQHSMATIPDSDLRDCLEQQLLADIMPAYTHFWERSMDIAFTGHRDKYMRYNVPELEKRLKQLFSPSSGR